MKNKNTEIDAIIFDLGNVLILHDARVAAKRFAKDMGVSFQKVWDHILTSKTEKAYTRGEISTYDFFNFCKKITKKEIKYEVFKKYWNEIFTENKGMNDLLKKLKKKYPLYMISNTNPMHWKYLKETFPHIFKHFKRAYPSHQIGARKPDPQSFKWVLKRIRHKPETCVFVDDIKKFADGAKAVGIHGIQFKTRSQFQNDLKKLGVNF